MDDHKIKDQKVFIKLSSVTALQKRYQRAQRSFELASQSFEDSKKNPSINQVLASKALAASKARMEAFEEAIALMELPIS